MLNVTYIPYIDHLEAQVQILGKVLLYMREHDYEETREFIRALKDSLIYVPEPKN